MSANVIRVLHAESDAHFETAKSLFVEYAAGLGIDLCFQDFDHELANLATQYSPPSGALLLAMVDKLTAGCVALRRWDDDVCEMKRLYVREPFRRLKLGRLLTTDIVDEARKLGYRRVRLDTLPSMHAAQALYRSLGFRDVSAYRHNPIAGTVFMERDL